jgi:hypothetical protein
VGAIVFRWPGRRERPASDHDAGRFPVSGLRRPSIEDASEAAGSRHRRGVAVLESARLVQCRNVVGVMHDEQAASLQNLPP